MNKPPDNNSTQQEKFVTLPTLPVGTFYSAVAIDLQHWGRVGDGTNPSIHYPKTIQIPKPKYDALIALFNKHKIKQELRPALFMSFSGISIFVNAAYKYKWFANTSKELLSNVFNLITFLQELKNNEKKLCKVHFTFHTMVDGKMSNEKLPFTIKGHFATEFLQSILSSYEKVFETSVMNGVYKNLYDAHKSGSLAKIPSPLSTMTNKKKEKYYTLHLLYFLLQYQVKDTAINHTDNFLSWPVLTSAENKRYPMRRFHLFVGRFMELAGLIQAKSKDGYYDDDDLIDVIKKIWVKRGSSPNVHDTPTLLVSPPLRK